VPDFTYTDDTTTLHSQARLIVEHIRITTFHQMGFNMPTLRDALSLVRSIHISSSAIPVEQTVARELRDMFSPSASTKRSREQTLSQGTLRLGVVTDAKQWKSIHRGLSFRGDWMLVRIGEQGGIELLASRPHLLYYLSTFVREDWATLPVEAFRTGKIVTPSFPNLRPVYDLFLTQHARTVRNFNREEHIRHLARLGFSHVEVNGLAMPVPFERGPQGELLHRFYTYCPSLDQFVASRLNRGFYDDDYLQANLNFLKKNAQIAEQYGLTPGLVCFEPRSVPDNLLQRYPMLRGARVDHPIRSWHPRFNLSIAHPVVQQHYAEMMENLMHEVPQLDYLSIWSNDSGAGFEYTSSLYVGRNGGGYVIREWKGEKEIAESAANNLVRFLRILRDAGRRVNPNFRTLIRLEPFWAEHDYIWAQLGDGLDVEVSSLLTKGWKLAYRHPKYKEAREIHGTALHNRFVDDEKPLIQELRKKGSRTDIYFQPGVAWNHEPLLGISFPWLVYDKLADMVKVGVETPCFTGSAAAPSFVPFHINQELIRAFQVDPNLDLAAFLRSKAREWIGSTLADDLVRVWKYSDDAFRSYPIPIWIYSGWGVWYRLLTRPIVPNIENISEEDRAYYEKFLLATSHNRCRVDFRYDVGFDLVDPAHAHRCVKLMDRNLFPLMERALKLLKEMKDRTTTDQERAVLQDQYDRMRALKCWYRTERNVAAWVAGVHTYLESNDVRVKKTSRRFLREMVLDEIENAKDLLDLWETSTTNWMIISGVGETTFIYYENFGELVKRKIQLMRGRENDEPYVDPDFQWRVPGFEDYLYKEGSSSGEASRRKKVADGSFGVS
jgi:hypothetical protein